MRGVSYRFIDYGIKSTTPFTVYANNLNLLSNYSNSFLKGENVLSDTFVLDKFSNVKCLEDNSIFKIVQYNGPKITLNNDYGYRSNFKYGLYNGNYSIINIPIEYPIALLNNNKQDKIVYLTEQKILLDPIIINIKGGSINAINGDYFSFSDSNNRSLNLANGDFRLMRETYRFIDKGIDIDTPFLPFFLLTEYKQVTNNGFNSLYTFIADSNIVCLTNQINTTIQDYNGNKYIFNNDNVYSNNKKVWNVYRNVYNK